VAGGGTACNDGKRTRPPRGRACGAVASAEGPAQASSVSVEEKNIAWLMAERTWSSR
jgi:hypothetical protein